MPEMASNRTTSCTHESGAEANGFQNRFAAIKRISSWTNGFQQECKGRHNACIQNACVQNACTTCLGEPRCAAHGMVIEAFKKRIGDYLIGRTIGEVKGFSHLHFCLDLCQFSVAQIPYF